ncbi:hypothetical protein AKJ65_02620 [candidate division MSBL1 archaeon SCGC-AAA259E19]|uniref:Uncharacterized protein n=1 Tax=candidate division MSBL1 archaeon SCGC-AAA259E19 TaxID=1698264 RepID=A0A133ULJ2_9EURY|nr:hypothetical protein AKJ65_02620 [candidate division MSBL1 archaeon SCGC-AAA259E19]
MKGKLNFVALISIAGSIPLLVALFEIWRSVGSEFYEPSILSFAFLGILEFFIVISIQEKVEFFEYSEKITIWITLFVLIITAIVVGGTSI